MHVDAMPLSSSVPEPTAHTSTGHPGLVSLGLGEFVTRFDASAFALAR